MGGGVWRRKVTPPAEKDFIQSGKIQRWSWSDSKGILAWSDLISGWGGGGGVVWFVSDSSFCSVTHQGLPPSTLRPRPFHSPSLRLFLRQRTFGIWASSWQSSTGGGEQHIMTPKRMLLRAHEHVQVCLTVITAFSARYGFAETMADFRICKQFLVCFCLKEHFYLSFGELCSEREARRLELWMGINSRTTGTLLDTN